jgi:hypothetical protein
MPEIGKYVLLNVCTGGNAVFPGSGDGSTHTRSAFAVPAEARPINIVAAIVIAVCAVTNLAPIKFGIFIII